MYTQYIYKRYDQWNFHTFLKKLCLQNKGNIFWIDPRMYKQLHLAGLTVKFNITGSEWL